MVVKKEGGGQDWNVCDGSGGGRTGQYKDALRLAIESEPGLLLLLLLLLILILVRSFAADLSCCGIFECFFILLRLAEPVTSGSVRVAWRRVFSSAKYGHY